MLDWLRRESLATLAMFGTALTLLAQLATLIPFAPPLAVLLTLWNNLTQSLWPPPLEMLGLKESDSYQMHDLLSDSRYLWTGRRNYVALEPSTQPAHVFRLRHRISNESGFDYFA